MPTIELNGVEIRYEEAGSGPTVLFLHGLGSAVQDWEGQPEVFDRVVPEFLARCEA